MSDLTQIVSPGQPLGSAGVLWGTRCTSRSPPSRREASRPRGRRSPFKVDQHSHYGSTFWSWQGNDLAIFKFSMCKWKSLNVKKTISQKCKRQKRHKRSFCLKKNIAQRNAYKCIKWHLKDGHFWQKWPFLDQKKWHFEWPNQNSRNTFIVQTFPKYGPYVFYLVNLSLLGAILAIFQFCGFSGLFWPFFPCK